MNTITTPDLAGLLLVALLLKLWLICMVPPIAYFTKVERLKRRARRLYRERAMISANYDCGVALLTELSPAYDNINTQLVGVLKQLREIDPGFPDLDLEQPA